MNFSFVLCLILIGVSVTSSSVDKVFRKCCQKDKSLLKTSSLTTTENDTYECIDSDRDFSDIKIANPNSNLVINPSIVVKHGIPLDCNLQETAFDGEFSTSENICYDRVILVRNNDTYNTSKPETVALKCAKSEIKSDIELKIQTIYKCCPKGNVYDSTYHICRGSRELSSDEWILKRSRENSSDIYVIHNGHRCYSKEYTVEINEGAFEFALNGSVLSVFNKTGGGENLIEEELWCIDREYNSRKLVARVCTKNCTEFGAYCLRKCCLVGKHLKRCGTKQSTCVQNTDDSILFNISSYIEPLKSKMGTLGVLGIRTDFECPDTKSPNILNSTLDIGKHSLDERGWLKSYYSLSFDYCLDSIDNCNGDIGVTAVVCVTKSVVDSNLSFGLICVTVICLIITIIVYCLPKRRNLNGLITICYLGTMLLGFICLGRIRYGFVSDVKFCAALGYGKYFWFVSAFVWLNVMCFDIWRTLRSFQRNEKRKGIPKKFWWYSLYAWGLSVSLTLVTFLMDWFNVSEILDAEMGKGNCWFGAIKDTKADWPRYIYFVIPMGIICCVNLVFWLWTAVHYVRVKTATQRLHAGRENEGVMRTYEFYKDNFLWTGKMWIVMGCSWFIEFISILVTKPDGSTPGFMNVMDRFNELLGLWIFLFLVIKPNEIWKHIKQKYALGLRILNEQSKETTRTSVPSSSNVSMNNLQNTDNTSSSVNLPSTEKKEI